MGMSLNLIMIASVAFLKRTSRLYVNVKCSSVDFVRYQFFISFFTTRCSANQLTGFYVMATLLFNELMLEIS